MQDYDDDGEAAAGGRLLHLLQVSVSPGVRGALSLDDRAQHHMTSYLVSE